MNEIERLQDNLLLIRRAAGWTAEEFGPVPIVAESAVHNAPKLVTSPVPSSSFLIMNLSAFGR